MKGNGFKREKLPFVTLLPNIMTILGLCAGLTSIRFMLGGDYQFAAAGLIVFAALIDGLDGLLARRFKATSDFGAELDSLSDFLNFGVAPGLLVFQALLGDARGAGWLFVLWLRTVAARSAAPAPPPDLLEVMEATAQASAAALQAAHVLTGRSSSRPSLRVADE